MGQLANEIFQGIREADRRRLGKAFSFMESTRPEDESEQRDLLSLLAPYANSARRIGISGSPGAGKSTLIEALGLELVRRQHRVAVLAIDPTSSISGGSILGDKIRMPELARSEQAFIRPSPSGGTQGGTAQRTRECIMICEAAGFDTVLIETVGVGQAELSIASMIDLFVLVLLPSAGDDVQAVKRGIMEVADIIWLNKSDIDDAQSRLALGTLHSIQSLLRSRYATWDLELLRGSALEKQGIDELVELCDRFFKSCEQELRERREMQRGVWFDELLRDYVLRQFVSDPERRNLLSALRQKVMHSELTAPEALLQLSAAVATDKDSLRTS